MNAKTSPYDDYAAEYSAYVVQRERDGVEGDPRGILPHLLTLLGNVAGCTVLDAGCGEGYLARILAERGARVTGVDLAQRLIDLARADRRREKSYRTSWFWRLSSRSPLDQVGHHRCSSLGGAPHHAAAAGGRVWASVVGLVSAA